MGLITTTRWLAWAREVLLDDLPIAPKGMRGRLSFKHPIEVLQGKRHEQGVGKPLLDLLSNLALLRRIAAEVEVPGRNQTPSNLLLNDSDGNGDRRPGALIDRAGDIGPDGCTARR